MGAAKCKCDCVNSLKRPEKIGMPSASTSRSGRRFADCAIHVLHHVFSTNGPIGIISGLSGGDLGRRGGHFNLLTNEQPFPISLAKIAKRPTAKTYEMQRETVSTSVSVAIAPALAAVALLTLGHGRQGTLLGICGGREGMSAGDIGLVMSAWRLVQLRAACSLRHSVPRPFLRPRLPFN
ncbi:hypothetical protein SAMN05443635_101480 [Roseobacter denitrificans OCh 114]|nr:hypothetical protein SAMN05443635_101480 [Roseobacter denitrificans OCh 114]